MMTIWKTELTGAVSTVKVPTDGEPISVAVELGTGNICVWWKVDETNFAIDRHVVCARTGSAIPSDEYKLIGMVQPDIGIEFHVFVQEERF